MLSIHKQAVAGVFDRKQHTNDYHSNGSFRGSNGLEEQLQHPRNMFPPIFQNVGDIGRASRQLAVYIASRQGTASLGMSTPRVVCLSGIASYAAAMHLIRRSDGAQRACFFWKKAGPIVAHYKWTQVEHFELETIVLRRPCLIQPHLFSLHDTVLVESDESSFGASQCGIQITT